MNNLELVCHTIDESMSNYLIFKDPGCFYFMPVYQPCKLKKQDIFGGVDIEDRAWVDLGGFFGRECIPREKNKIDYSCENEELIQKEWVISYIPEENRVKIVGEYWYEDDLEYRTYYIDDIVSKLRKMSAEILNEIPKTAKLFRISIA